jgi:2-amino-4-hydroxy-6-hydroxymethyldihydropteridine diphosphokinase
VRTALVALGSNLGDRAARLQEGLAGLATLARPESLCASHLYETAPWGIEDQPVFLNAVARFDTSLEPAGLLAALKGIERAAGRPAADPRRWGPRTLDLDLLDLAGIVGEGDGLTLPHPRIAERAFVLVPLCEIAPLWSHPLTGRTAVEMLAELDPDPALVRVACRLLPATEGSSS